MSTTEVLANDEARRLLSARLIASLGSLRADGSIHVVPMWFRWDGESVLLPTNQATAKARNLADDPRATVMIHDSKGGFEVSGISISGTVEIIRGEDAGMLNREIHLRYITAEGLALVNVGKLLESDDITLRLEPRMASIWDMRGLPGAADLRRTGHFEELEPVIRHKSRN